EPERRDQSARLVIMRSAKRMKRLIQDLLDVAVVEAGQLLRIQHEPVSTADLVRDAVETQRPLATSAGLELRGAIAPGVKYLSGDRDRLLQVFENLIGNALKFTPKGGRISVCATPKEKEVVF